MRQEQRIRRRFFLMCLLLAVMVLGSLRAGFTSLTMGDVFRVLTGGGTREENLILFDFRMVRIVLAVLVGAGLSVSPPAPEGEHGQLHGRRGLRPDQLYEGVQHGDRGGQARGAAPPGR